MANVTATERRLDTAEEFFDIARSIVTDSTDPGATYAGFLRGLGLDFSGTSHDPLTERHNLNELTDSAIVDRVKRARQAAVRPAEADVNEFPTEWTLDSLN